MNDLNEEYVNNLLHKIEISLLVHAIHFSAIAHSAQRRKDEAKTPYINHPIEVMHILMEAGITDVTILCAAVLHDTIEDTGVTYQQLADHFSPQVADMVQECSDDKSLPKEIRKQEQIKHAKHVSDGAKLIKAADKLSNLSSLDSTPPAKWSPAEIDGYFTWAYAVWLNLKGVNEVLDEKLCPLFEKRGLTSLALEEMEKKLTEYYNNIKETE